MRDYAKAIVDLMDDDDNREQLAKIGRVRVEDELAWAYRARLPRRVRARSPGQRSGNGLSRVRNRRLLPAVDGRKLADVMTDRIAHRGPDAGGVWSHEDERVSLHLGHRRLSIIDLSAAADQPLRKGNLALIYNGELYNYKELRARASGRRRDLRHLLGHRGGA